MVAALSTAAHLVLYPRIIRIGQINSPITARKREGEEPIKIGSGKSKFPEIRLLNLPQPWVIIKMEGSIRKIARPISDLRDFVMYNKNWIRNKITYFLTKS